MTRDDYGTPPRPVIWPWVVVAVVVLLIAPVAWGIRVATSEVRGQGDAVATKNSAENWTEAQARFEGYWADIQASDRQIAIAREALDASPKDRTAEENYYGLRTYCEGLVADYNADARSYLSEDFRAADLPSQIDPTNPLTDCKE